MSEIPQLRQAIRWVGVILFSGTMFACVGVCAEPVSVEGEINDDIRLIIDISGSMKKNDPENLRVPAVNLLVKLLPADASAGVWTFGRKVNTLVPFRKADESWKELALQKTGLINSVGLYTNIGAALEQVLLRDDSAGSAILLTDGVVDISKDPVANQRELDRIINEILPKLVAKQKLVHTVALSENADKTLLKELASSTGGLFEVARSAEDLTRIFLRMFDDAVIQDRLPMHNGEFTVDSTVEEFTLLAFKSNDPTPIQLRSPENVFYLESNHPDFINWYSDKGFELVTVKRPIEGQWRLFADEDPQNRVTVLSDLKLRVSDIGNAVYEGDVPLITVSIVNEGVIFTNAKFLNLIDVQLIVRKPSGERQAKQLSDYVGGIFSSELDVFSEPGRYQIKVSVNGRTFQREMVQEVEYLPPVELIYIGANKLLKVMPASRSLISDEINVIVSVSDESGKRRLLPMQLISDSYWQTSLENFGAGQYQVELHVKGISAGGKQVNFKIDRMPITVVDDNAPEIIASESEVMTSSWLDQNLAYIIMGGVGNLFAGIFVIWFFLRRKKTDVSSDEDPEIPEMPAPTDESPEEAEAEAEAEADYGEGLSDIVDAWIEEPESALKEGFKPEVPMEEEAKESIFDEEFDLDGNEIESGDEIDPSSEGDEEITGGEADALDAEPENATQDDIDAILNGSIETGGDEAIAGGDADEVDALDAEPENATQDDIDAILNGSIETEGDEAIAGGEADEADALDAEPENTDQDDIDAILADETSLEDDIDSILGEAGPEDTTDQILNESIDTESDEAETIADSIDELLDQNAESVSENDNAAAGPLDSDDNFDENAETIVLENVNSESGADVDAEEGGQDKLDELAKTVSIERQRPDDSASS